ncbi:MAG: hypothetical protein ACOY90_10605 [Candidatus Zhuqueibacterota bacterium]
MALWHQIRQWKYPREFRIAPSLLDQNSVRQFQQLIDSYTTQVKTTMEQAKQKPDTKMNTRLLADIGTGLWRIKQKVVHPVSGQPLPEMRSTYRHVESVWDVLIQTDVEIMDHTNQPFDPGMSLKVIAFQQTENLQRDMIIETIKPSIYYKKQPIQIGEVIVGTPVTPDEPKKSGN